MNVDALEAMIVNAIEKVKAAGWAIVPGSYGAFLSMECCPLGAVAVANGKPPWDIDSIAKLTGLDGKDRGRLTYGVDKGPVIASPLFDLGARLRARYVEQSTEPCADGCAAEQGEDR